jgi:hypothetical protein
LEFAEAMLAKLHHKKFTQSKIGFCSVFLGTIGVF